MKIIKLSNDNENDNDFKIDWDVPEGELEGDDVFDVGDYSKFEEMDQIKCPFCGRITRDFGFDAPPSLGTEETKGANVCPHLVLEVLNDGTGNDVLNSSPLFDNARDAMGGEFEGLGGDSLSVMKEMEQAGAVKVIRHKDMEPYKSSGNPPWISWFVYWNKN